jgi:OFA family oxalate/formate antiporter-like MFS transporter
LTPHQPIGSHRRQSRYGYVVVAAAFVMMIMIWGTFSTFGVFFGSFVKEFGWTRTITSGASALNSIIFGILCIFAADLSERLGPRRVMTFCGFMLGLSFTLISRLTSSWELYLYFGLGVSVGMSPYIPLLSLVPKWFSTNRGRMNAIVLSGMGFGTMIAPPVASRFIAIWQWRNSYLVISIITLGVMIGASQFLRDPPKKRLPSETDSEPGTTSPEQNHRGFTFWQAACTREFALLCVLYFSFLFCLIATLVHIVVHATGLGISISKAAVTLSIIGGASIAGMNVMGNLADRLGNKTALGVSYSLMGLSFVWLTLSNSLWHFYIFSAAFGFSYGGLQVLFSPLVAELFGIQSHGVILATAALVGSVGAATGPMLAGYVFDTLGSYTAAFVICAILAFVGLVSSLLVRKSERV